MVITFDNRGRTVGIDASVTKNHHFDEIPFYEYHHFLLEFDDSWVHPPIQIVADFTYNPWMIVQNRLKTVLIIQSTKGRK